MRLVRDTLFLLQPNFEDPALPGRRFYCWHCALLEGVLAGSAQTSQTLDIVRLPWARPRAAMVDLVGEANQSMPLLVLADGHHSVHATGRFEGLCLVADKDRILRVLVERHGFAEPHP